MLVVQWGEGGVGWGGVTHRRAVKLIADHRELEEALLFTMAFHHDEVAPYDTKIVKYSRALAGGFGFGEEG